MQVFVTYQLVEEYKICCKISSMWHKFAAVMYCTVLLYYRVQKLMKRVTELPCRL